MRDPNIPHLRFTRTLLYQLPLLHGPDVSAVQQALTALQVQPACGETDGVFGESTARSISAFCGNTPPLARTGVVTARVWDRLMADAADVRAMTSNVTASVTAARVARKWPVARPPLRAEETASVKRWFRGNYAAQIDAAIAGVAGLDSDLVCAVAAKESAVYWVGKIGQLAPSAILGYCVFDASGDAPGTHRYAFPRNQAALRADPAHGAVTDMLIEEANKSRAALRGFQPANYLYKGYGIFQNDLQNIRVDPDFFCKRLWYSIEACLARFVTEMSRKLRAADGDVRSAVRLYNGGGARTEQYAADVLQLWEWCKAADSES